MTPHHHPLPPHDGDPLERLLAPLATHEPTEPAAHRALGRARAALASAPRQRATGSWWQRWKWRLVMPTTIAAGLILMLSLLTVLGPTTRVSAAEVLRRAERAREAFDGWYTMEARVPGTDRWITLNRVNPTAGKRFTRLSNNPKDFDRPADEAGWVYIDKRVPVSVRYDPSTRTATVAGTTDVGIRFEGMPLSEDQMAAWVEAGNRYTATNRTVDGHIQVELIRKPTKPGSDGHNGAADPWPQHIVATFDHTTGLLHSLSIQQKPNQPLVLWARFHYHTPPITDWHELIGKGVTIKDLRPTPATAKLLDRLDDVIRQGIGIDTALLVQRVGYPIRGGLSDDGSLTLYAQRGDKWATFTWRHGKAAAHWPEPTLDDAMTLLKTTPPDRAAVCDGTVCWWQMRDHAPWRRATGTEVADRAQYNRLATVIWWGRDRLEYSLGSDPPIITAESDPDHPGRVTLKVTVMAHWQGQPEGQTSPLRIQTLTVAPDLGPLPVSKTDTYFNDHGKPMSVDRWDYSLGDLEMYRQPVRVPTYWRKQLTFNGTEEAMPQFFHLLPQPGRTLDAKWFTDPTKRWPSTTSGPG